MKWGGEGGFACACAASRRAALVQDAENPCCREHRHPGLACVPSPSRAQAEGAGAPGKHGGVTRSLCWTDPSRLLMAPGWGSDGVTAVRW